MIAYFVALDFLLARYTFELTEPGREIEAVGTTFVGPPVGSLLARVRRRTDAA